MAIELLGALGAGSGLDTKAIVDALVEAKRAPQAQQITQRIETSEATVSAYGQVSAALEGVRSAFNNLNDVDDLTALTIRNSSTAVAVEAGAGAQGGQYALSISRLATSEARSSSAFADATASLNGGTDLDLTITLGAGGARSETLTGVTDTPAGIVSAINEAGLGLQARIVDTGAASDPLRIVVSGALGEEGSFTLTPSAGALNFSTQDRAAADAEFVLNGLTYLRPTNDVTDVLPGVTLTLQQVASDQSFSLEETSLVAEAALRDLVDAYNLAQATLANLTDPDGAGESAGVLQGDSVIGLVQRSLRELVTGASNTPSGDFNRLLDFGIQSDRNGQLVIDEGVFAQRVRSEFSALTTLLTADTNRQSLFSADPAGLAGEALKSLDEMLKARGPLLGATSRLQDRIGEQEDALLDLEDRMAKVYDRYLAQFTAMETLIEQMNGLSDSLTSTFDTLPFSPNKK
jgi:flagellar hook-associated protein 2